MLLIGDGSGSKWGSGGIGWACVALLPGEMIRRVFHGAMNEGTNTVAELMAYICPLLWYHAKTENDKTIRVHHIHIITDNQHLTSAGNDGKLRPKNVILWTALNMFSRFGYQLQWHWCRREDVELNRLCDAVAGNARKLYKEVGIEQLTAEWDGLVAQDLNPWE